jgi:hypothetical protein
MRILRTLEGSGIFRSARYSRPCNVVCFSGGRLGARCSTSQTKFRPFCMIEDRMNMWAGAETWLFSLLLTPSPGARLP